MKKILILLCILMMFTTTVYAENNEEKIFAPSITVNSSVAGKIVVTVPDEADNAAILAEKKPTLSIPCDFEKAYVEFDGEKIDSTLQDGEITFVVEKVGDYVIIEGEFVDDNDGSSGDNENKNDGSEGSGTVQRPSTGGGSSVTKYEIMVQTNEGGTITPGTSKIKRGTDAIFKIEAKDDYEIEDVLIDGVSVGSVYEYTFENVKAKHTIEAIFKLIEEEKEEVWENPFKDVDEDDWFYEAVKYANMNGLYNGVSENEFAPYEEMTRGMLVTVLWRLENKPVVNYLMMYEDVNQEEYYGEAIRWATSEKLVNGYSNTSFAPDEYITREDVVTILYRYAKYKDSTIDAFENIDISFYGDYNAISEYAISAFKWGCGSEIVKGISETALSPKGYASRAEVATMIKRFIEK